MKDTGTYHYELIKFNEGLLKDDYSKLEAEFEKFIESGGLESVKGTFVYNCGSDARFGYATKVVESEDHTGEYAKQRENLHKAFNFFTGKTAPDKTLLEATFNRVFCYPCDPLEKI